MPRDLHELPKLRDSLSYLYLEHGRVEQDALSIQFVDKKGRVPIPAASLAVLLLGPGTTITHAAVKALADNGCSIVWCGEDAVRCYAQGLGETRKAYHVLKQAALVCDAARHAQVVRRMYELRFAHQLPEGLSLPQVRGLEGVRVRTAYARASQEFGVPWRGRRYDRSNWGRSDPINRALSAANACLNGVCHAGIVSAGYSPALGFIHTGKQLSFVYDIADLYKVEVTIPVAFRVTAESTLNLEARARQECRRVFREARLLDRIVSDIDWLLDVPVEVPEYPEDVDGDAACPTPLWEALWGSEDGTHDGGDDPGEGAGVAEG